MCNRCLLMSREKNNKNLSWNYNVPIQSCYFKLHVSDFIIKTLPSSSMTLWKHFRLCQQALPQGVEISTAKLHCTALLNWLRVSTSCWSDHLLSPFVGAYAQCHKGRCGRLQDFGRESSYCGWIGCEGLGRLKLMSDFLSLWVQSCTEISPSIPQKQSSQLARPWGSLAKLNQMVVTRELPAFPPEFPSLSW